MKLNEHQILEFTERGILRLENLIPNAVANQAKEIALEKLSKFHENERWNYESVKDLPFPKANSCLPETAIINRGSSQNSHRP